MKILSVISQWASWLIAFLFSAAASGLIWDEMSHQLVKRGWTQKLCHLLIKAGARAIPHEQRNEYIRQSLGTIEELLSNKRHLAAVRISITFATTLEAQMYMFAYATLWLSAFTGASSVISSIVSTVDLRELSLAIPRYKAENAVLSMGASGIFMLWYVHLLKGSVAFPTIHKFYKLSRWLLSFLGFGYVFWLIYGVTHIPALFEDGYMYAGFLLSILSFLSVFWAVTTAAWLQSQFRSL